mmetsp:Transcript_129187/g.313843  ORF Transcript_129187/g.313843 Transcript_129187/m.313843 type:complete len:293 (-) Transcript_129187:38-916(-)
MHELLVAAHLQGLGQSKQYDQEVAHWVLPEVLLERGHELLHLRRGQCSDAEADAHDQGTHAGTAHKLDGLEEGAERLAPVGRLEAVSPELVSGRREHARGDHGGKHIDEAPEVRGGKGRVQADEEGRDLVAHDAVQDVSKDRWRVGLVEVGGRDRQVHGLPESVVRDRQGDRAEDRAQCGPPRCRRQVHALHDDVRRLKEGELDEVGGQGRVQVALDLRRIQLFDRLAERHAVHQQVVDHGLRHGAQGGRHHGPHGALGGGAHDAAHEVLVVRHAGWMRVASPLARDRCVGR